jgi:hypothetical protein
MYVPVSDYYLIFDTLSFALRFAIKREQVDTKNFERLRKSMIACSDTKNISWYELVDEESKFLFKTQTMTLLLSHIHTCHYLLPSGAVDRLNAALLMILPSHRLAILVAKKGVLASRTAFQLCLFLTTIQAHIFRRRVFHSQLGIILVIFHVLLLVFLATIEPITTFTKN